MIIIKLLPLIYIMNLAACLLPIGLFFHRRLQPEVIRGFLLCYLSFAIWAICNILTSSGLIKSSIILYKISHSFPFIITAFLFYFSLCLRHKTIINKKHLVSLIPAFMGIILIFTLKDLYPPQFIEFKYGILAIYDPRSIISIISLSLTLIYLLITSFIFIRNIRDNISKRIKIQSFILLLQVFLALILTIASLFILVPRGISSQLTFTLGPFFYSVGTTIIITRYRLLQDDPSHILGKIWDNISEPIILLDSENKIDKLNKTAQTRYPQLLNKKSNFIQLFSQEDELYKILDEVKAESIKKTMIVQELENELILNFKAQGLIDEFGDFYGYIIILSSGPTYEELKKRLGITPTQWEISLLLLQGMEYKEIADSRNISFFTVRNHVHQIYDKTNCKNRYELQALFYE